MKKEVSSNIVSFDDLGLTEADVLEIQRRIWEMDINDLE